MWSALIMSHIILNCELIYFCFLRFSSAWSFYFSFDWIRRLLVEYRVVFLRNKLLICVLQLQNAVMVMYFTGFDYPRTIGLDTQIMPWVKWGWRKRRQSTIIALHVIIFKTFLRLILFRMEDSRFSCKVIFYVLVTWNVDHLHTNGSSSMKARLMWISERGEDGKKWKLSIGLQRLPEKQHDTEFSS